MGKPGKKRLANLQQGFTLVELIVAMAIAGIVIGAIYSTYKSQQDSYVAQTHVAEMQQNLRAALYVIGRDIRMAGYNPQGITDLAGFVPNLPDGDGTDTTDSTGMAFTIDEDGLGTINADDDDEQIAYRIYEDIPNDIYELQKSKVSTDEWLTVADNIEAIDFVYLDDTGNPIDPATVTNLPLIRSVQISLVARTGRKDKSFPGTPAFFNQQDDQIFDPKTDNIRRRLLTTEIQCRNMGI